MTKIVSLEEAMPEKVMELEFTRDGLARRVSITEHNPANPAHLDKLFYARDNLDSIRELVDGSGALQTRFGYDMWAKVQ